MAGEPTKTSAKTRWIGGRPGRPLQRGDTSAVAEFYMKPGAPFLALVIGAVGVIGLSRMSFWSAAIAVGLLALAAVDFVRSRRNPLLGAYSSYLQIRPRGLWGRTHRISFAELGGWRHWSGRSGWLGFETIASRKVFVSLYGLSRAERRRLISFLDSLKLGQPGFRGPTDTDLTRYQLKVYGVIFAVIIGLTLLDNFLGAHGIR